MKRERSFVARVFAVCLCVCLLWSESASAGAPAGAVKLAPADISKVQYLGRSYLCGHIRNAWLPGRSTGGFFLSMKAEIAALSKTLKKTKGAAARTKIQAKIKSLRLSQAKGEVACHSAGSNLTPTPTPASGGNFDILGNLTEAGKAAFQVPSNLNGSVNRGIGTWNNKCYGCHHTSPAILTPNTFPAIKSRIQQSPMYFNVPGEVSDQEIADVVAYRNF